MTAVHYESP